MQIVVLAGGLGTRLRGTIPDGTPKPMAEIAGRPFLHWLLDDAVNAGATELVILVGYRAHVIRDQVGPSWRGVPVRYSEESEPRGTGGAVRDALPLLAGRFVVVNGDTYVESDLRGLVAALDHAAFAMTLAQVEDTGRFGGVDVAGDRVVALREKGGSGRGFINAGVYGMGRDFVETFPSASVVSFERDVMVPRLPELRPPYVTAAGSFFDIGVPDDLRAADAWFTARSR